MCLVANRWTQVTLPIRNSALAILTLLISGQPFGGRMRLVTSCDRDFRLLAPILQSEAGS